MDEIDTRILAKNRIGSDLYEILKLLAERIALDSMFHNDLGSYHRNDYPLSDLGQIL